jgi:hypothetical protein
MPLGDQDSMLGAAPRFVWSCDGHEINPVALGEKLIDRWKQFFRESVLVPQEPCFDSFGTYSAATAGLRCRAMAMYLCVVW